MNSYVLDSGSRNPEKKGPAYTGCRLPTVIFTYHPTTSAIESCRNGWPETSMEFPDLLPGPACVYR